MHKLTSQDPEAQSLDLVADNIAKLTALFPEILTEGADGNKQVDWEALRELLGESVEDKEERYNFTWHGKAQARRLAQTPSLGTLRPCPAESKHWDNTQNLFIEGDNLEVLKLLQKSYHQRVKMIYIDPPYNTGKDFIYPDNYRDNIANYLELTGQSDGGRKMGTNTETSGRYHTNWLNMMYPRLKLARNLLRDDGVIFISIDDTEVANLRKLCDEIFGEENFIDAIIWKKRYGGGAKEKYLVSIHEYILVYAKALTNIDSISISLSEASIDRYYTLKDHNYELKGPYRTHPLEAMKSFEDRPNLNFPVRAPDGQLIFPKRQWRWSKEKMYEALEKDEVEFSKKKDGTWSIASKQYLKDGSGENRTTKFFSIIDDVYTQHGTNEILNIFGDAQIFSFPKPSLLLSKIVAMLTQGTDIVLDFFSGSATTAHAVMALNAEDSGNRKFIMVQLPEPTDKPDYPTIADIGKERIRRAGDKILADKGGIINLDVGFKVFKLDSTNIKPWDVAFDTLEQDILTYADSIKSDRSNDDVLYEILLKYGLDLSLPISTHTLAGKTVYSIGGVLVVCLDHAITLETVEAIAKLKAEWQPETAMRVVFRDSGFADDVVKVNAVQILKQAGIDDVRSV